MNDEELTQNKIMEDIFMKFDEDGSGSISLSEISAIFKENNLVMDREAIREMFQGTEFDLEKFKQILQSGEYLQRFRTCLEEQRLKQKETLVLRYPQHSIGAK